MHSDKFKPISYLKLIKKYVFSEGEQFPLKVRRGDVTRFGSDLAVFSCDSASAHVTVIKFFFYRAISSLQVFITVPVCVICIFQDLYICDLRSGRQSRDHILQAYGKIMKFFILRVSKSNCNDRGGIY